MTETPTDLPKHPENPRWHGVVAALCVLLLTLTVFLPTLHFQFVSFDDGDNVYQNPHLNPVTAQTLNEFWRESYNELYTPVTYSLWTGIAALPATRLEKPVLVPGGKMSALSAEPFHALGVFLHALNSVLLFALLARLPILRGKSPIFAALGAAFWAVHPLQSESVAWVTGHNNVFSGTFMLLALLAFVRRLEAKNDPAVWGWYLFATTLYSLALLAKPTAAALPLVAFVLGVGAYRYSWRSLLLPLGVWLFLAGGLLLLTRSTITNVADVSLPIWQRPFVVGDALAFYIGKLFLPIKLGIDYGRQPEWLRTQPWFYAMWLIPVAIGVALYLWQKRDANEDGARTLVAGASLFVLGALPMLGVVPYYFHRNSTVADRYVYLALIGAAMIIACLLLLLPNSYRRIGLGVVGIAVLVCAVRCYAQNQVWRDSQALYINALQVNPGSMVAHFNLASVYSTRNESDKALEELLKAADCRPEGGYLPSAIQMQIGGLYAIRGEAAQAITAYRKGIRLNPKLVPIRSRLALLLWQTGDRQAAQKVVNEALKSAEDPIAAAYIVGDTFIAQGVAEIGQPLLEQVARTKGENAPDANYSLALWYEQSGNRAKAVERMEKALESRPGWRLAKSGLEQLMAAP